MRDTPSEVVDALRGFLRHYSEDRGRWPLWTYSRHYVASSKDRPPLDATPPGELVELEDDRGRVFRPYTWAGEPWAERIRFSSYLPLVEAWGELRARALKGPRRTEAPDVQAGHLSTAGPIAAIPSSPLDIQARIFAVLAGDAHPAPPETAEQLLEILPSRWTPTLPLDDADRQELSGRLLNELEGCGPPRGLLLQEEGRVDQDSVRRDLFLEFLEVTSWKAKEPHERLSGRREEFHDPDGIKDTEQSLATTLSRRLGLLIRHDGGPRGIDKEMTAELQREADEIVNEVKSWKLGAEERDLVAKLLPGEPELFGPDGEPLPDRERKLLSKVGHYADPEALARRLRFPFLLGPELKLIDEASSTVVCARELVQNRIVASIKLKTLANLHSAATSSQPRER